MALSSLHTHTLYCDGKDDVETMCRSAYEKGLCSIGFSAHGPIYKKTGIKTNWHLSEDRLYEYIDDVRIASRRWKDKLKVYLGLELDYMSGLLCAADRDILSLNLDYIIGSVHYIFPDNGARPFTVDGSPEEFQKGVAEGFNNDGEAVMHAYWDTVSQMITIGGFDILGHVDIIKKNNLNKKWYNSESTDWHNRLNEIAGTIACSNCIVELNTGGLNRNKISETYPSLPFLHLLHNKNIPVIITSDAHNSKDLDGHYNTARETLLQAAYGEHTLLKEVISGKPVWESVKL